MALIAYWVIGPNTGDWWTALNTPEGTGWIAAGLIADATPATAAGSFNPASSGDNDAPTAWTGGTPGTSYRSAAVVYDDVLLAYGDVLVGEAATLLGVLTAAPGAYTLTGQAAALRAARRLVASAGSYTQAGQPAALRVARRMAADAGSYTLTGVAADLIYAGAGGAFTLTADAGSYSMAGQAASLRAARRMAADAGSYTYTGVDAGLQRALRLAAGTGAYTATGQPAALRRTFVMGADRGTYFLQGRAADLIYSGAAPPAPPVRALPTWYHQPGALPMDAPAWIVRELQRVSQATYGAAPYIQMQVQHKPPEKVRDGFVVLADGSDWNPGAGAGIYARISGAWVKL